MFSKKVSINDIVEEGTFSVDLHLQDQHYNFLKRNQFHSGDRVIVEWEDTSIPVKIVDSSSQGCTVTAFRKSGLNWAWPNKAILISYRIHLSPLCLSNTLICFILGINYKKFFQYFSKQ